ncbi:MAG: hypothetical protein DWH79_04065 [Planctomycetota bacterium]|nr:MAG: hypothetical protein DWH79_04065 [Planctomycetota bacterium]
MNLGLLGFDDSIATIVAAGHRSGDRVVMACDLPATAPLLTQGGVPPRAVPWESLLDTEGCDAVLVGADGWNETRAEAVRKLVQAGRTLVLSHPLEMSMLWAYELDMIRRDSGAILIPVLPDRLHPFIHRLRLWIDSQSVPGGVESIGMERRLRDRSRESVQSHFCRDADLVRELAGAPVRLSTLGAADADQAWSTLAVGLTAPGHPPVRWQVVRSESPGLTITATAASGSVSIGIPADPPAGESSLWSWTGPGAPDTQTPFDGGAAILARLRMAVSPGHQTDVDQSLTLPLCASWDDAARGIELAETISRSLAKGRGIDLHQEEFTEIGTFKGTMASLGCGIILLALMFVVLATLLGGIARQTRWEFGEQLAGLWPGVVLGALSLFLLLQTLPLLIGSRSESPPAISPPPSPTPPPSKRA